MSLSENVIKIIGLILAIVGLALLLSAVGISFLGVNLGFPLNVIVGVVFIGSGIYIIRGGTFHL